MLIGLPPAEYLPKKFDEEVASIQYWFKDLGHPRYIFQSKYHKSIPTDGYYDYAKDIWKQVCVQKKVDLPARQELLAELRCNKISAVKKKKKKKNRIILFEN